VKLFTDPNRELSGRVWRLRPESEALFPVFFVPLVLVWSIFWIGSFIGVHVDGRARNILQLSYAQRKTFILIHHTNYQGFNEPCLRELEQ